MGLRTTAKSPLVRKLAATLVVSAAGLTAIKYDEGEVRQVYLDPVGIPTVCVGHTSTVTRADLGKTFSDTMCQQLLRQDTKTAQSVVQRVVKVPITQEQFDALVSFQFNTGALGRSTLLKYLNSGQCRLAAEEFPRWNKAKGRVLKGLVIRRDREKAEFLKGCS